MENKPSPGTAWSVEGETIIVLDVIETQNFSEPGYPVVPLVNFIRLGGYPEGQRQDRFMHLSKFNTVAVPDLPAVSARAAWCPYLVDRADGCKGHFAIARWNPAGYREVWNLRRNAWGSASDDVLTLDEATKMMLSISFHPNIPVLRGA